MKKVLIVAAYLTENKHKLVELLSKHFDKKVEFSLDSFENFALFINEEERLEGFFSGINLKSFDFVYIRSKTDYSNIAKTVAICLESNKIPYADKAIAWASYIGDKLTSQSRLALGKIAVPASFYAQNLNNQFSISWIKKLTFPLIIKDLKSQRMTGIYIVNNEDELIEFIKKNKDRKLIFQKFIDIQNEYRIFVIEGTAVSAHTKIKRDYTSGKLKYLNPTGEHVFVDLKSLPKKLIKEAEKAANELLLDIAGVDMCIDSYGKIFCLEVNRGPGIDYEDDKPEEIDALVKFFQQKIK